MYMVLKKVEIRVLVMICWYVLGHVYAFKVSEIMTIRQQINILLRLITYLIKIYIL